MKPLDRLPSIKLKFGLVIVTAVAVTALAIWVGVSIGIPLAVCAVAAAALALAMVQVLARGMTSPLREMAAAARAMARGDHDRRVTATSSDEVGELARAFNAMSAELAQVDRMRRDLVANVSHELRTPITGLQALLENLIDGVELADHETFELMHRQVERLGRLVTQLLDLSRLEAQGATLERTRFALEPVLQAAAAEARPRTDVELEVACPRDIELTADRDRLHQVVANLVDNGVRHASATVAIQAAANGQGIEITVKDDGPGIPAAEADRIFERFYRLDAARATEEGGTGLGLAIAREIVERHGGSITATAPADGGCEMQVRLPKAPRSGSGYPDWRARPLA